MPHHSFSAADPKYRGFIGSHEWSLCIGAGVSAQIMPTWMELTRLVFTRATGRALDENSFKELTRQTGWSLDAWLQAGLNAMIEQDREREEFVTLIEEELYRELLARAAGAGQRDTLIKALGGPKRISVRDALSLWCFLESEFGSTTLFTIARWLRQARRGKNQAHAVLTFNADGLLDLILTLLALEEQQRTLPGSAYPKDEFRRVLRASDRYSQQVTPIYHLHGCIVPKQGTTSRGNDTRDGLIFPESGYSRISSTVFTWQQTVFLSHAQAQRLVFIGLSMSDPNLRRWLSWCTANAVQEQTQRFKKSRGEYILGEHLWITTRPSDPEHEQALESSLLHLGTRIAWLDTWNHLPVALDNLLGVN